MSKEELEEDILNWISGAIGDCTDRRGPVEIGSEELSELRSNIHKLMMLYCTEIRELKDERDDYELRYEALDQAGPPLEQICQWMLARSYATGNGDDLHDLLAHLELGARERGAFEGV